MATIPSWPELFGSLNTKEGDAGRSITAPAAYLADLLQLLRDRFEPPYDFDERRPDIATKLTLNGDQSFSLVRQLDIVNSLLGEMIQRQAGASAEQVLAAAKNPFLLPFEYQHERVRQMLLLLRTPYRDLHQSFAPSIDVDVLVRERLGLSPERAATVVGDPPANPETLALAYGLAKTETLANLVVLDRFQRATQLDGPSLRQLLFCQLSQYSPIDGVSERSAAGQLFINGGLGGFVTLDAEETRLTWNLETGSIRPEWFDRVHRLLCLSRWSGVDVPSLDLVLRQLCGNTLDWNALRRLAVLIDLRDRTKAPLDVLCSLFAELDGTATLGNGDDPDSPASLFDRVFNGDAATLAEQYLPSGSPFLPQTFAGWSKLGATGDLLIDIGDNKQVRGRIQKALGISATDLAAVITAFRNRATLLKRGTLLAATESLDSRGLSLLHRIARIAQFVDLAPLDLLQLVDLLQNDPGLKVLNAFDVLYHEDIDQTDLYQVLEEGPIEARSWLIQNLLAIATWAGVAGLEPADLAAIVVVPGELSAPQKAALLATAQGLYEAFLPTALNAASLQSDAIDERSARVALETFLEPARRLVAAADARIAVWNKGAARDAAKAAIASLDVITKSDIEALQLGEDLATYLQALLIRRGVLDDTGVLREDQLPVHAGDLVLEPDGSARFGQIFDFLNGLYTTALADASVTDQTSAVADTATDNQTDTGNQADSAQTDGSDGGDDSVDAAADDADADTGTDDTGASDPDTSGDAADSGADTSDPTSTGTDGDDPTDADPAATDADPADAVDPSTDVELHLYPSDLLSLGFSVAEADEWIERLTFLRILDSTGMVQDPSIFADPSNVGNIQISIGFDSFFGEIHAWLAQRRDRWFSATVMLPDGIWDDISLTDSERQDLVQNLTFNNHIDAAGRIIDKRGLLSLTADTFELALPFYRRRRPILNALQGIASTARQQYLAVGPDDLRPIADRFAATDIHLALTPDLLDGQGRLTAAALDVIDQAQAPFALGSVYSTAQGQSVWSLLQQVNSDANAFRLTTAALATVNITGDEAADVIVSLCADGYLQPNRTIPAEQIRHFSVTSGAQDFQIPQYADYSRDVFFLLQDVAVATAAAEKALTSSFQAVATAQESAVIGAIASQLALSPDAASAILKPLLRDQSSLTAAIMAPVLKDAVNDVISEPPSDRVFCAMMTRAQAFANLAGKLAMTPGQIQASFRDQQLTEKFPEGIDLPSGVDGIDALWAGPSGQPAGAATFAKGDFVNLASLAGRMEQPIRPIDVWLAAQLTTDTIAALTAYRSHGSDPAALQSALLEDVNRVLLGPSLYDTERFHRITFRAKVQDQITLVLQGNDFPGLNRLLLEDAYPRELARNQYYLFRGANYWTFDANTLDLDEGPLPLETLCADFKALSSVDAVFTLPSGEHWLLAQGNAWRRAADHERWMKVAPPTPRVLGRVESSFDDPASIDGVFLDSEGRLHLLCDDQYVRYSNWPQEFADEGYPKRIAQKWHEELGFGPLPSSWDTGIKTGAWRSGDEVWLFKDNRYISSAEPGVEKNIVDFWGRVRNNLGEASSLDGVLDIEGRCAIVSGDQVTVFSNSLESDGLSADEGYPRTLTAFFPDLPEAFAQGIDAGLTDDDGTIHLFRDLKYATRHKDGKWESAPISQRWGLVKNTLHETGNVDAAFAGLDGKVYLFSGAQYVRYSTADFSRIDEGYPRTIAADWGGLTAVSAAFVLDGKTYLFDLDGQQYVQYSTRDYSKPDDTFPQPIAENWWNLPASLKQSGFNRPDAVFIAGDGRIHLFNGTQTIAFDRNHRWWSEPVAIHEAWSSLPFETVSAAFTARDGRTYVFSAEKEPNFVRYTDRTFQRLDDRFPKPVKEHWGKLVNNIERSGRVDAAVAVMANVNDADEAGPVADKKVRYRYLFAGDQFYRYSSDGQQFADEGYPLRIQNNLRRESHFAHLDAPVARGIDGAWADAGNVYVFCGDIYVASFDYVRELEGFGIDNPQAADVEDGCLRIFSKDGWHHTLPPEAHANISGNPPPDYVPLLPGADQASVPRVLRTAPPQFQGELSAILRGLDHNVYLFGDKLCYDQSLERQYPTGGAWGCVRNLIAEEGRVDSALMGRDGKFYLFRGDQFISYTPTLDAPTQIPDLADANPLPIADHWGGLTNVCQAFVQKGVTYLLESPGQDGSFRYVRYFGIEYSRPNEPVPLSGDFSFWKIPADYQNRGFDRVDAVLGDGNDLFLIHGVNFIHYDALVDTWSVPRHLSLRWPGLPRHNPDFAAIRAVAQGPDSRTYFFADETWLSHDGDNPSALAFISERWAVTSNRITQNNRVDATLVFGDQTYLFSGDEYVRYTGTEYEYVDTGYPRAIAGLLRQEAPFQQLPDDIEDSFANLKPEDTWVTAAFSTGGVVVISLAGRTFALSANLSRNYPFRQVAVVRNELQKRACVDAALVREEDGTLFLLSGDQYVRYSQPDLYYVDDGYPRSVGESLLSELPGNRAALPLAFQQDLDAAYFDRAGTLVLFKNKQFVRSEPNAAGAPVPADIKGFWGRVSNPFLGPLTGEQPPVDAAFVAPEGSLYVFKGGQYLRYTDPTAVFVDEGYPRAIRDEWGDLPDDFKAGIDGAFVFDGRTYLCRGKSYVRYGDPSYRRMDPIYPQLFSNRWRASNDFALGDLLTIQRYVALDQSHPSADGSLSDFLLAGKQVNADPYTLLANLFGWEVGDIEWLKRHDAFLDRPNRDLAAEVNFDIAQVLRIYTTLDLCTRIGSHPQEVYEQVWLPLYQEPNNVATAADTLERLLGTLYPGDDWTRIQRQLGDALSGLLRDAQVAWLMAQSGGSLAEARDLSDVLLTDVEVDASLDTSPIVEATGALQLYFYRYLTNLEPKAAQGDDATRRPKFKEQWQWLQNYRVWEANRKVFLYPESYIRPELRSTRTAAFKSLQQNLQQGEITNDSVTQAYKKYLDEYTEVSRLIIAGGYVWHPDPTEPSVTELTLFGFTRTDPRRYYYRTATFNDENDSSTADWTAWESLGIDINSDHVYPVRAFGRTFVFWAEVAKISPDDHSSTTLNTTTKGDTQTVSSTQQQVQYCVNMMYSFCDLSDQWSLPQQLGVSATEGLQILSTHLRVSGMTTMDTDTEESIVVDLTYDLNFSALESALGLPAMWFEQILPPRLRARRLTADLTGSDVDAVAFADNREDILNGLFDPIELNTLDRESVIVIGTTDRSDDAPWYSFDIKGGSFLARPSLPKTVPPPNANLLALADNTEGLPKWDHVDACLDGVDGNQYLFNDLTMTYAARTASALTENPIDSRWGLIHTKVHEDGKVDAAWQRDGVVFLSRSGSYLKYSHGLDWADPEGDLGSAQDRQQDGIPNWPSIDAAFTDKANTTWFFQGARYVALDSHKTFSPEAAIKQRWGREPNDFTMPAKDAPVVVAAFTRNGRSFLIGHASYTSYTDPQLLVCETPKPQSLRAILEQLNCTNSADADPSAVITGAVEGGGTLFFKIRSGGGNAIYQFTNNKFALVTTAANAGPWQDIAAFMHGEKRFALSPIKTGLAVTLSGSKEQQPYTQDIRAALPAADGSVYLFGVDRYVVVQPVEITVPGIANVINQWSSRSLPIADRWGWTANVFTKGGAVTAAFVRGDRTFLVNGDSASYVRYSGSEYRLVDAGYPKPLAANPDGLPQVPFSAAVPFPDGHNCLFIGTQYVMDNALSVRMENQERWGRIRTNILVRGVDTAYRIDNKHYLFSGNELACYTASSAGKLPPYMDQAPVQAQLGSFAAVRGAFTYKALHGSPKQLLYIVGRDSFLCCNADEPEQPLAEYPRNGMAGALVADLRLQFNLPSGASEILPTQYEVYALSLQGSLLFLDTDDSTPGQRVFRLDLSSGALARDLRPPQIDWATLRRDGSSFVDVPNARYSFRADQVMETTAGIPALWDSKQQTRSISAVWGGRPFDAAIPAGDDLLLFAGNSFSKLAQGLATDDSGGSTLVNNLRGALTVRTPIRGSFSNMPAELLDGFDAALPVQDDLYMFKGGQYAHLSGAQKPQPVATLKYDLVRLTTSTAARLSRELFIGGLPQLLSLRTQEVGDTPGFSKSSLVPSTPTMIRVNPDQVNDPLPIGEHLDFSSANGVYLWEIFFHAPSLIAGMLSTAQRFEEAKEWYEYIFDPTEPADAWKFLPFLTEDVERIVLEIRDRLNQLDQNKVDTASLRAVLPENGLLVELRNMNPAFQGERTLTRLEVARLAELQDRLPSAVAAPLQSIVGRTDEPVHTLAAELQDLTGLIAELNDRWISMKTLRQQIDSYLDDPFDPHAIAALRPIAYRKATVMRYLDNLLSWGDMLFGQYTRESINEARMLYVIAWDVLGPRPESLGRRILPPDSVYKDMAAAPGAEYDMLEELDRNRTAQLSFAGSLLQAPGQDRPYFFIPPNDDLEQYWTKVADRLYKIRHGLNILGIKEPLALFAPPINPMDLVNAVAGGGLSAISSGSGSIEVPHYRFTFLVAKAEGLAQSVATLGSELLSALEKRDAEALYRLQSTQEGLILTLTRDMQKAQLAEAQANLLSQQKAKEGAQKRLDTYQNWLDTGFLPMEDAQIALLATGVALNFASSLFNAFGVPLSLIPAITVGLFSFGATEEDLEKPAQAAAMTLQTAAGAVQGIAEILGITAQHQRAMLDWTLQRDLATIDVAQIDAQIQGAQCQVDAARQQIAITGLQIEQNKAISDFYRKKFTNQELYEWMASRLSDLHYQTYQLALDMGRAAERSFQFERGQSEAQTTFIQGQPWDSQRRGLLAGYTLGLALNRMESAFIATDARRFEITKAISLLAMDPIAFLKLKADGVCEFDLSEALFDYDFPGHYRRQVKTIAVDLNLGDGVFANATLTQLTSRIVMEADPKAVSFLLSPKEAPPQTIRSNWKVLQQIALSTHTQYETNSGVFELNFDGDHYLPFEGTGAVSRWRLELGGPPGAYDVSNLTDVIVTLKYSALQGGDSFSASVRGLLKPTDVLRAINLSVDFANAWQAFLQGGSTTLQLPLSRSMFPNMVSGAISAIFTRYEYDNQTAGGATFAVDIGQQVALPDGKTVDTSGLTVRAAGTTLNLTLKGDPTGLKNAYLVMRYKGGVR